MAREGASRFAALAGHSIAARGRFAVALAGGSTPRDLYALLATPELSSQIDWTRVDFFWGDERAVPPDHPDSNYRMVSEALLGRITPPAPNVYRVLAEKEPDEAARAYEETLRDYFAAPNVLQEQPGGKVFPRFDLVLLGLGSNGHTASLFPHTPVLHESSRWVAAEYVAEVKMWRITLTAPAINAAAEILFLVAGSDKAPTVRAVLHGPFVPDDLPAQLVQPTNGRVAWLLDREAAKALS